ncbi:flavodoxin domain-containing protein [Thermodesulfobacteriota bacterium]
MNTLSWKKTAAAGMLLGLAVMLASPAAAFLERPEDVIEMSCGDNNTEGKKVLIAYDTKHGSTGTILQPVAETLCADGFQVELLMARDVEDIADYDAVIAGSPIYDFRWLPGTRRFLKKHRDALAEKEVALFITCTYLKDENDTPDRRASAIDLYVQPILDKFPEIDPPLEVGILSGEFTYAELYPWELIRMKLAGFEEGDYRNGEKINDWADAVSEAFGASLPDE